MSVSFVTIKGRTRGKATREVQYQGVGKFVTEQTEKRETVDGKDKIVRDKDGKPVMVDILVLKTSGVVTDIKDALEAEKGDMQALLDNWAVGFNLSAYKGVADTLSEYIKDSWSEAQVAAFRLAVNNLQKIGIDIEQAVTVASSKLPA